MAVETDPMVTRKKTAMWVILGLAAVVVGIGLWLAGRRNGSRFSVQALRKRWFGESKEV